MKHIDILMVDDERRYADMLASRLALRGLACKVCYDGFTAIELVDRKPFQMVIPDLGMPDLYGVEVLIQIKKRRDVCGYPHRALNRKGSGSGAVHG